MEGLSTVDSFTKRSSDAGAYATSLATEPEIDDFVDEGGAEPASPSLSARAAAVADPVDVAALVKAALPYHAQQYRFLAGRAVK